MKKLLLSFALVATLISVKAQTLSKLWYHDAGTADGVVATSGSVHNSVAYNKVTNKLYVAHRGTAVYIVDPADFDPVAGTLNSSAYSASTKKLTLPATTDLYSVSKIRVDDNGVIYAVAMSLSGTFAVYRWTSEADLTPSRKVFIANFTSGGETKALFRVGDSFAIYGTGDDTYLYVGSSYNNVSPVTVWNSGQCLTVLKVTTGVPALINVFDLGAAMHSTAFYDIANRSISAESKNILWVNNHTSGVEGRKITLDLDAGTMTDYAVVKLNSTSFAATYYLKDGSAEYLVSAGATSNTTPAQVQNIQLNKIGAIKTTVTPNTVAMTSLSSVSLGKVATPVANTGFSDIAHVKNADNTTTFFFLSANNGLGAFKTSTTLTLPVSLTSFSGSLVKGQSTLAWSTASESNNKGFEVLRSTDGTNFSSVGFVNAKGQNGNSATALDYSFVDRTAAAGVNYYQLKQMDNDGKSELFQEVVSVDVSLSGNAITVYPNPATSYVNVSTGGLDFKGFKYEIFDGNGKKVLSQKAKSGEQQISVANLAPSIYFLKVSKDNVPQKTVKLIKE